ncbi:ATP-grasp domain-containing protein [Nocardioidaceae bacterium]|nr:ATP-grasp domain-containing protein [Nocardioidaceae bacterium]
MSPLSIKRILVANRGEIARRVFATCRRLGIDTVAVHSDADASLPFVTEADAAVRLPGNAPGETYLRADLILDAARRTGADAIHPGYGFLSENADFARAVEEAGLTWIGPDPASIEAMGSKIGAKQLMAEAGVPVLTAPAEPTEADLPLLVKASAGGGGRGMRVVRRLEDLEATVEAAREEAASAFGDGTVFVEPYVEQGRHVEVQLLGDGRGSVWVVGDRDCSVQRRHQKVVEEAPAPGIPDDVREALHEASRKAGEAIDYRGAGTVEFLYDAETQRFFFLEMNTRLQVEHPVTEAVAGVDLVELQIAVAEGRSHVVEQRGTGSAARNPSTDGGRHSIEVRLYAEDPAADYQPQSGLLSRFEVPGVDGGFDHAYDLRLDSGFGTGDEVGTFYDAMLAKIICTADSREAACRRLAATLRRAELHGLRTNRDLLVEVLTHPAFVAGELGTDFLDRHDLVALGTAEPAPADAAAQTCALLAAAAAVTEHARDVRLALAGAPSGWRNVVSAPATTVLELDGEAIPVRWWGATAGTTAYVHASVAEDDPADGAHVTRLLDAGDHVRVDVDRDGVVTPHRVFLGVADGGTRVDTVDVHAAGVHLALRLVPRFVDPADQVSEGSLLAPMPGTVVAVRAAAGDHVGAGQPLLVLEAMKMQHTISAPADGTLAELPVVVGAQVAAGEVLAVVEPD